MTLLEVAKHALEAMEDAMYRADTHEFYDAKESLRYAIEQAEQAEQKPVELTDAEILDANYPDGEEADPIIAAPDSELIAFSRAVMAVQRDREGKPIAHWRGVIAPQKDAAAPTPRKPLTDEEIQSIWAKTFEMGSSANTFARAIERAHGIGEQT